MTVSRVVGSKCGINNGQLRTESECWLAMNKRAVTLAIDR